MTAPLKDGQAVSKEASQAIRKAALGPKPPSMNPHTWMGSEFGSGPCRLGRVVRDFMLPDELYGEEDRWRFFLLLIACHLEAA